MVHGGSFWKKANAYLRLQLPADHHLPLSINAVNLKDRLRDIETNCCDRLHASFTSSISIGSSVGAFELFTRLDTDRLCSTPSPAGEWFDPARRGRGNS